MRGASFVTPCMCHYIIKKFLELLAQCSLLLHFTMFFYIANKNQREMYTVCEFRNPGAYGKIMIFIDMIFKNVFQIHTVFIHLYFCVFAE